MTELDSLFEKRLSELAGYFRHEEFYYKNIYDFSLRIGKAYQCQPFTSEEYKFVTKRVRSLNGTFAPNHCFLNSGKLAMADSKDKIKYVEGFIMKKENEVPILHAWNEINGKVIDITLINKYGEYTLGTFEDDVSYRGTVFPTSFVRKAFSHNTRARSVISDISDKNNPWPILKCRFTEEYIKSL